MSNTLRDDVVVLRRADQRATQAFGGVMRANKPIIGGYSADGRPSAAIFYWSHSVFVDDFEFGLHPHKGFEIVTFVLDGANSHYDTAGKQWVALTSGDVQVIRSGSGISHNEKVAKGTRAFQIWFDPGYHAALHREPSYTDYRAGQFVAYANGPATVVDLIGGASPVHAETEGLSVRRAVVEGGGTVDLPVAEGTYTVAYFIDSSANVAGRAADVNDAVIVTGRDAVAIHALGRADVFMVSVPAVPSYPPVRQR